MDLPAFPLSMAHLPGDEVSLRVFEDRYLSMLASLEAVARTGDEPCFATMLIERGSEVGGGDVRSSWGTTVLVENIEHGPVWSHVVGRAASAIVVRGWVTEHPYPVASVEMQTEESLDEAVRFDVASAMSVLARSVLQLFDPSRLPVTETVVRRLSVIADGRWWTDSVTDDELWRAYWRLARALPCGPLDRHSLLGPGPLPERVRRARDIAEHLADIIAFRSGN